MSIKKNSDVGIIFENQIAKRNANVDEFDIEKIFLSAYEITKQEKSEQNLSVVDKEIAISKLCDFCIGEWDFHKRYEVENSTQINFAEMGAKAARKYLAHRESDIRTQADNDHCYPYYDPLVATLASAGYVFEKINRPMTRFDPSYSLMNDLFETLFRKIIGAAKMLELGLYPDAFVSWRTIHESECIIQLLISGGDRCRESYINHIAYNNYFRNPLGLYTKEQLDQAFNVIKSEMKKHGLKSKDMKKFIEYGWLYDHPDWDEEDKTAKLNFRDGVERVAKHSEYAKIYELSSEITHSSAVFFYANDDSCKDIAFHMIYQSCERIFWMYHDYMSNYFKVNPKEDEIAKQSIFDVSLISRKIYSEDDFLEEDTKVEEDKETSYE
jgi:hypothetical protein